MVSDELHNYTETGIVRSSDDIVTRLLPFIHDEVRIPAGLIMDTIDEIERLRAELKDADDDFHALKAMFDKMRAEVRGE